MAGSSEVDPSVLRPVEANVMAPTARFCSACGGAVGAASFCPSCGAATAADAAARASKSEHDQRARGVAMVVAAGGALLIIGSLLPWITATIPLAGTITRNGIDNGGDGILLCALGVIGLVAAGRHGGLYELPAFLRKFSPIIAGIVAAIVAAISFADMQSRIDKFTEEVGEMGVASLGAGLYVTFLGAAALVLGGFMLRSGEKAD